MSIGGVTVVTYLDGPRAGSTIMVDEVCRFIEALEVTDDGRQTVTYLVDHEAGTAALARPSSPPRWGRGDGCLALGPLVVFASWTPWDWTFRLATGWRTGIDVDLAGFATGWRTGIDVDLAGFGKRIVVTWCWRGRKGRS